MSAVQRIVQKATVRIIASELDRRAADHQRAIQDLQAHVRDLHAHIVRLDSTAAAYSGQLSALTADLESVRARITTAQERVNERINVRLDQAATRLNTNDDAVRAHDHLLTQLQFDLAGAHQSLADLTGVLERLTLPG